MLWASGLLPRRLLFLILAVGFGAFGAFFLLKGFQLNTPGCLGAPVCAFSIVFLLFGATFLVAATILAILWAISPKLSRPFPPL